MSIKVLLAVDSDIVRRGIRSLLRDQPDIELVGEASDFPQTIQMMKEMKPEVILLDLHMPGETRAAMLLDVIKSCLNHGSRLVPICAFNDEETKALAKSLGMFLLLDRMELSNKLIPSIMQLGTPIIRPPYLSFLKPD